MSRYRLHNPGRIAPFLESEMLVNHNPDTGIAYGIVAANDLDSEVVFELMTGRQAEDLSYEDAWADYLRTLGEFDPDNLDALQDEFNDAYCCDEPLVKGVYQGVHYESCWLGGALNFVITESPVVAQGHRGSICVPGMACVVNPDNYTGNEWYSGYGVPLSWWPEKVES